MFVYAATLQAAPGKDGEAAGLVTEYRDVITEVTGHPGFGWSVAAGAPFGSFTLSTRVEGTSELLAFQQKLAGSAKFHELASRANSVFSAPAETMLNEVVGATGEQGDPKPLVMVTQATMIGGSLGAGMAWSNSILEYVTRTTGIGGLLVSSTTGTMFQVGWIFGTDNGDQMDEVNGKLAADASYHQMLDEAGDLFIHGSANRQLLTRLP